MNTKHVIAVLLITTLLVPFVMAAAGETIVIFGGQDIDQTQKQEQHQSQLQIQLQLQRQQQEQKQAQEQKQGIYQPIVINLPTGVDISQLDVGEAKTTTRLMYPQEVITFPIAEGEVCSVIAGAPVAVYTIAGASNGRTLLESTESIPTYDPIYHKMTFGVVVPIDSVGFYTTKAGVTAGYGAGYLVIDNRGDANARPAPGYVMVEVTTIPCKDNCPLPPNSETTPVHNVMPDTYPVDAQGRAITSG